MDFACAAVATHVALHALADTDAPVALRAGTLALHAALAALFLRRSPAVGPLTLFAALSAAPSIALGLAPLALPGVAARMGAVAQAVYLVGALGAAGSLLTLGRSFGVLPARRGVVTGGPYRWVRHPAYVAEWAMFVALVSAAGPAVSLGLGVGAMLALALRIRAEERALRDDPAYSAYAARVRYRVLPGVY